MILTIRILASSLTRICTRILSRVLGWMILTRILAAMILTRILTAKILARILASMILPRILAAMILPSILTAKILPRIYTKILPMNPSCSLQRSSEGPVTEEWRFLLKRSSQGPSQASWYIIIKKSKVSQNCTAPWQGSTPLLSMVRKKAHLNDTVIMRTDQRMQKAHQKCMSNALVEISPVTGVNQTGH